MKKLKPEADLNRLLRCIAACGDDVLFVTREGDILNLKSTLSSYIFASLAGRADILARGTIQYRSPEDGARLAEFLQDAQE